MQRIRDFRTGTSLTATLVVLEASARKTKTGKDYLSLKLSDGENQISGNYWDWQPEQPIMQNTVYDVKAAVTEWQGTMQLNISGMTENKTVPITDFMPSSGADVDKAFESALSLADGIRNVFLRKLTTRLLYELEGRWKTVPGAKAVHHAYVAGTLIHSVSVATIAYHIASCIEGANKDLATAGALLHDIGKLFTYGMDGVTIDYTDEGKLYEHAFIGAELVGNFAEEATGPFTAAKEEKILGLLRHIILSHHKNLEYGAVITPKCIEAYIVHYADAVDATAEQIRKANCTTSSVWTDKIWALDNMQHISHNYVSELFAENAQ